MKKINVVFLSICFLIIVSDYSVAEARFEKEMLLDTGGLKYFEVDTGAGSLRVSGYSGSDIMVDAVVYSDSINDLSELKDQADKYLQLSLKQKGDKAILLALVENKWFGNVNISVDLDIRVPEHLDVVVDDGSGDITIQNLKGNLELDDGSGNLQIYNIGGSVHVDDGSGELVVDNVGSKLTIDDGSGEITIKNISGNVMIDDGSGEISATDIEGDFTVDDGSGFIEVEKLAGQFHLIDGGSGYIKVNGKRWED